MGITTLEIEVANPNAPDVTEKLEFLVDSGAFHSVVPSKTLEELGIPPVGEETYRLANGDKIVRRKGFAAFRYNDRFGVSDVIFGEPGDSTLLGALTLEGFGLALDPLKRELREIPMLL